jgi:hypothetical protein
MAKEGLTWLAIKCLFFDLTAPHDVLFLLDGYSTHRELPKYFFFAPGYA